MSGYDISVLISLLRDDTRGRARGGLKMAEVLVVASKVKKLVKEAGFRTGGDYLTALSGKIEASVRASIQKVQAEGKKKTLGAEDIA